MEFTLEILSILAWPVTILIILFLFKKQLNDILYKISRLKFGNFEFEFGKDLDLVSLSTKKAIESKDQIELEKGEEDSGTISGNISSKSKLSGNLTPDSKKFPKTDFDNDPSILFEDTDNDASPIAEIVSAWAAFEISISSTAHRAKLFKGYLSFDKVIEVLSKEDIVKEADIIAISKLRDLKNKVANNVKGYSEFIPRNEAQRFKILTRELALDVADRIIYKYPEHFNSSEE